MRRYTDRSANMILPDGEKIMSSIYQRIQQAQADASWNYVLLKVEYHARNGGWTEKLRKDQLTSTLKNLEIHHSDIFPSLNRGSTVLETLYSHPLYRQIEIKPIKVSREL